MSWSTKGMNTPCGQYPYLSYRNLAMTLFSWLSSTRGNVVTILPLNQRT